MAIRGIDAQVMAHRVTDYVRDASAALRRNDMNQDFLAHQNRVLTALASEQVQTLQQKEPPRVHVDEQTQRDDGQQKKRKRNAVDPALEDLLVDGFEPDNPTVGTSVPHILDIEV